MTIENGNDSSGNDGSYFLTRRGDVKISKVLKVGLLSLLLLIVCFGSWTIIGPGERGVVTRLGAVQDRIMFEGLHFKIPLVEGVKEMDVKTQKIETEADAASRDMQQVTSTIALNYHLNPGAVNKLYQEIGKDYKKRIIDPSIQEAVKASTAKYNAEELISKRPMVRADMEAYITEKLAKYHILVDGLNIVNFQFSPEFDKSIEAKQVAVQEALQAQNILDKIVIEKQQKITEAQGEAEAIRIKGEALKSNANVVVLDWIKQWDGHLPTYMGGNGNLLIGIGDIQKELE